MGIFQISFAILPLFVSTQLINLPLNGGALPPTPAFQYLYSYEQQSNFKNYFSIATSPDGADQSMNVKLYAKDKTYSVYSPQACAESLLVSKSVLITSNKPYVLQWNQMTTGYLTGFNFAFARAGIVTLKYEFGKYWLFALNPPTVTKGKPLNTTSNLGTDLDVWQNWRMEFSLATNGFVNVYKNGVQVGAFSGVTSLNVSASVSMQLGIVAEPNPTTGLCFQQDSSVWLKNIQLFQDIGSNVAALPPLPNLPLTPAFIAANPNPTFPPTVGPTLPPCVSNSDCGIYESCTPNGCLNTGQVFLNSQKTAAPPMGQAEVDGIIAGAVVGSVLLIALVTILSIRYYNNKKLTPLVVSELKVNETKKVNTGTLKARKTPRKSYGQEV